MRLAGALMLGLWLAGCSSAPVHYYTLSSIPRAGTAPPQQLSAPLSLERLTIPTELDRTQLVRRVDATRVQIVDDHRWAAPLDDMMRRVLSEDLTLRLGSGAVVEANEPANGERRAALTVDIRELYGDVDCAVTLHAAWSVRLIPVGKAAAAPQRGDEEIHLTAGSCSGPAGLPPQISQAIAQLSDRIVSALPH